MPRVHYDRVRRKGGEAAAELAQVVRSIIKGLVVHNDGRILVKADPAAVLPCCSVGTVI